MEDRLKQRLVGATVIVALVVILAPMVLERELQPEEGVAGPQIPPRPAYTREPSVSPVGEVELLGPAPSSGQRQAAVPKPPLAASPPPPAPVAVPAARPQAKPAGGSVPEATEPAKARSRQQPKVPGDDRPQASEQDQSGLTAWAVQLGSFSNSANAVALRDSLRSKGYAAFLETVRVKKGRVTRLYVGPELMRSKAAASRKRLEKEVQLKGIVVRYPTG